MISKAKSPAQYIKEMPEDRQEAFTALRNEILKNLPKGFQETMGSGMISYVVPHEIYSPGYHCDPNSPLPLASLASQKHFIAFYHMGMYAIPELLKWFTTEYPKHSSAKLDMGKSCVRFKKPDQIPVKLIGQLIKKLSVKDWINFYEEKLKEIRKRK